MENNIYVLYKLKVKFGAMHMTAADCRFNLGGI